MALRFGYTNELGGAVKAACYAPAGYGKTVLCGTAPRPLIISAEEGLLSLKKLRVPFIEIQTLQDLREAHAWVMQSAEAKGFDTINLDSATDIAQATLIDLKTQYKDPRQAYGELGDALGSILRELRRLPEKHVYITCKDEVSKTTGVHVPYMPGNLLEQEMPYWGDELFALRIIVGEDGKQGRWLQTQPDPQYYAKDRSGALAYYEPPDLTHVFTKIKEHT